MLREEWLEEAALCGADVQEHAFPQFGVSMSSGLPPVQRRVAENGSVPSASSNVDTFSSVLAMHRQFGRG